MSELERTEINGVEVTTDDSKVKNELMEAGAEMVPYSEEDGINPAVVAGGIAGIAAAGYGIYRFGKWAIGKIRSKNEEKTVEKLQKKGYIVIPQRDDPEANLEAVDEENFEDEPAEEEVPKKAKSRK